MNHVEVSINSNIVTFTSGNNFMIVSRETNPEGIGSITTSFPLSHDLIERIESSKILKIEKVEPSGAYTYRPLHFCTFSKLIEVFTDTLQYYETPKNQQ